MRKNNLVGKKVAREEGGRNWNSRIGKEFKRQFERRLRNTLKEIAQYE